MADREPKEGGRAREIFFLACEADGAERDRILDRECGADLDLRREVESLLRSGAEAPDDFLDPPRDVADAAAIARDSAAAERRSDADPEPLEDPSGARTPAEKAGQMVGHYRLLEQIGEGGFGTVWAAEQKHPVERRVALKIIKLGMDTKQVIARFEAERQALAMMDHPNIARVLDAGSTDTGRPFFAMELVKGTQVVDYCDTVQLDMRTRLEVFVKVCQAVQHAHQKGVIHRDLKPNNVLVSQHDEDVVPKVIDFGIAKATSTEMTQKTLYTRHREMLGTPAYMSPEQAEMSGLDVDTRSDIYSLGVLLYELLTGTTPFESETLRQGGFSEMMRTIREEEPRKPSSRLSSLGQRAANAAAQRRTDLKTLGCLLRGDLDWIVMKCLEKDRTRRYATADALGRDIRRHLDDEPVVARPPTFRYRCGKFVRRNRVAVACGTGIALALGLGLAGTVYGFLNADQQRQLAKEMAEKAETARAVATLRADEQVVIADFATRQLSVIDAQRLGSRLRQAILDAAPEEQRDGLRDHLGLINFTNVGLESLRTSVFVPTRDAIQSRFAQNPSIEAHLLQALADTLHGVGLNEDALAPQERALAIRRAAIGNDHEDTLLSVSRLGQLQMARGDYGAAEQLLREALEGRRRILGERHPDTLASIHDLGTLFAARGLTDQAEQQLRLALRERRRTLGNDHPDTLATIQNLGSVLSGARKFEEAEPLLHEALEGTRRAHGTNHEATSKAMNNLAFLLLATDRSDEAAVLFEQALASCRATLGDDHGDTLISIDNMAFVLSQRGKLDEAELLLRESLSTSRRSLGERHPHTVSALYKLGALLSGRDQDEAEAVLAECAQVADAIPGQGHFGVDARSLLGAILTGRGRHEAAERHLLRAYSDQERATGSPQDTDKLIAIARRLVELYDAWEKAEQAASWRQRAGR